MKSLLRRLPKSKESSLNASRLGKPEAQLRRWAQRRGRAWISHLVGVEICDSLHQIGTGQGSFLRGSWLGCCSIATAFSGTPGYVHANWAHRVVRYAAGRAVVRTFTRMALPPGRRNHFCLLALGGGRRCQRELGPSLAWRPDMSAVGPWGANVQR